MLKLNNIKLINARFDFLIFERGKNMNNIVAVVGSQWGDEGKGKIVDYLSEKADVIVRFQGGHNAGHTLVIDGKVYKLSLLPSGIVRKGKISVIGNGVVIDPIALFEEIEKVSNQGISVTPENLYIAENASLILPLHKMADEASETLKGKNKIGTTGRGIGPAYEDKIGRRGIRVCDLFDSEALSEKINALVEYHNICRKGAGLSAISYSEIFEKVKEYSKKITPFVRPVWKELYNFKQQGKKILFEGAQGIMLDVDHGTYPYVTSSNTVTANAFSGSGLGVCSMNVIGIAKAYTTRVGSGPFPTELQDETGKIIGERGKEFGTVTGRSRRCGWFDAIQVRQACLVGGINSIILTKIDVLDVFEKIKICIGYEINGNKYDYLPAASNLQQNIKPIYLEVDGWKGEVTANVREFEKLPKNAQKYIEKLQQLVGVEISSISTSPERQDTIELSKAF